MVYEYHPEKRNTHISPGTVYLKVYNNHVFNINHDIRSLALKVYDQSGNEVETDINISPNYRVVDDKKELDRDYVACETFEEIRAAIENGGTEELKVYYLNNMNNLAYDLLVKH